MSLRRARRAVAAVATVLLATSVTAAVAQDTGEDATDPPPIDLEALLDYLPDDRLSAGLEQLELDGADYTLALDALWEAVVDRDGARATIETTVNRLAVLRSDLDRATRDRNTETARRTVLLDWLGEVAEARAEIAVAEFMGLGSEDELGLRALDAQLAAEADALPVHGNMAWDLLDTRQTDLDEQLSSVVARIGELDTLISRLETDIDSNQASLDHARVTEFVRNSEIPTLAESVATARWETRVVAVDQPLVVVDAYVRAARTVAAEQPECGVEWWMLAGIGKVESGHGTWGGSTVDADGDTNGQIIGLVLNGENGTAVIGDTDGGLFDGDAQFDRAVGPMQFIPSSWRFFGRDGNDDDNTDPHNLYDAATAAGDLLCYVDGNLDTDEGLRAALFSYNHKLAYVEAVLRAAAPFRAVPIPEPPAGAPSSGALFAPPSDD